ncbi:uncharacterized protein [Magallana gigas]
MGEASYPYRVHRCSKCPGDTQYYCESCPRNMCPQCKENHLTDLKTIDHNVLTYRDKVNHIPRHPSKVYRMYCEPCQVPACGYCQNHKKHSMKNVKTAYKNKRKQHERTIHTIRSEALFIRPVLLTGIKTDLKTCETKFSLYQSRLLTKALKLKDLIDYLLYDLLNNVFCDFDFKHRCLKQKIEMGKHIVRLHRYVLRYEYSTIRPLQFLSFIKKARLLYKHLAVHTSKFSMTKSLNKEDVVKLLSGIQITEREKRDLRNECLLKLMPTPDFHQSLTLTGGRCCNHISWLTSNKVWISDTQYRLSLTNTQGVDLHKIEDLYHDEESYSDFYGAHTVTHESELIYLDMSCNINKLSKDMKTIITFIKNTDSTWIPLSLHWSPSTRDLLVGMYRKEPLTGKVSRYNQNGQLTQVIQNDNTGLLLYTLPNYITENNNGDIVVSNFDYYPSWSGAVVVTDRGGRYRFSYTGHPPEIGLEPWGVCTDALSHILVCDKGTATVQMLDRDGQFLSHLLRRPPGIFTPCSLSYDRSTHRLWVGSHNNNKVVVFRYIDRQNVLTDSIESPREISTTEIEAAQQGNENLFKMAVSPKSIHFFQTKDVDCCYHISCVTPNRVWVSDHRGNLVLLTATNVVLHRMENLLCRRSNRGFGLHTVNSEGELIYVDISFNINKLLTDMTTITRSIERRDSTWKPLCVYSSPHTGDLLVALYRENTNTGKVNRYNMSGHLTQTIQHDNIGLELYSGPRFITENNNGDVVVSDFDYMCGAVVVTERGGKHRFSYKDLAHRSGQKSMMPSPFALYRTGSGINPFGICTDALSHILVCDARTNTVHMLDKNGQFLSLLLDLNISTPRCLGYDFNTHRLWVGSDLKSIVYVNKCIDKYTGR